MRLPLALPYAWFLAGCFSPNDTVTSGNNDDGTDSSASTGTTGTTLTTTTANTTSTMSTSEGTGADTSESSAGDTGADAPPMIENFAVQGSQMPAEISSADTVVLEADVTDDVGVARVEFYDGSALIASLDGAPYRTEFLVTSADNGGHAYSVVAYDTIEQSTEEGPIPLSVGIDGGAVVELREEQFRSRTVLGVFSAPTLGMTADLDVLLFGSSLYQGGVFTASRWTAARYSPTLSKLWQRDFPNSMTSDAPDRQTMSAPVELGSEILVMEFTEAGAAYDSNEIHPLNGDNGSVGSAIDVTFGQVDEFPPTQSLRVDAESNILVLTTGGDIKKLDADGEVLWEENAVSGLPADSYPNRLSLDGDGNAFVDVACSQNGCTETFLRKYSADGALSWTRDNGGVSQPLADGSVVSVGGWFGADVTVLHRDTDGNELSASDLGIEPIGIADAAPTPAGDVVFVGRRLVANQVPQGWAARVTPEGETVWIAQIEVGAQGRTLATGVVISPEGRLYVSGLADDVVESFIVTQADAWIAELAL